MTSQSVAELILQPFRHFTCVTVHSPALPLLYLRHSSFSNPSVASPTSQLILQPFSLFSYVTGSSLTSPGEPPMPRYRISTRFVSWFSRYDRRRSHTEIYLFIYLFIFLYRSFWNFFLFREKPIVLCCWVSSVL